MIEAIIFLIVISVTLAVCAISLGLVVGAAIVMIQFAQDWADRRSNDAR